MNENIINEELIENTFLYCYKKLNNSNDAEDLAQDIIVEALKAIRANKIKYEFYSWYWKMAHNRYCMFLTKKKNGAVSLDLYYDNIIGEYDISDDIINQEDINTLNYTISRMSKIHRDVIVLYYLKETPINQIASLLDIPVGTVKRRLFDAKVNIKRGIENMEKIRNEYLIGKSSYAPAELQLTGSYQIPLYGDNISDLITKQIFVACAETPKTVKEIADEIGVSPVYFEEKMKYLLDNKFIKESSNGKYLTDFIILDKQVSNDFYYEKSLVYKDIGKEITDALYKAESYIRGLDFYGNDFDYKYLLWILYVYASETMHREMVKIYQQKWNGKVPENNGKDYRVSGKVKYADRQYNYIPITNQKVWSDLHCNYQTSNYKRVCYANLYQYSPFGNRDKWLDDTNINLVMNIYDNPNYPLTKVDEEKVANLINKNVLMKKDDGIYLNIPVIPFNLAWNNMNLESYLNPLIIKYVEKISDLSDKILLPHIRKDLMEEYVHWEMLNSFTPLNFVFYYAMEEGKTLAFPEDNDYENSAAGLCIYC